MRSCGMGRPLLVLAYLAAAVLPSSRGGFFERRGGWPRPAWRGGRGHAGPSRSAALPHGGDQGCPTARAGNNDDADLPEAPAAVPPSPCGADRSWSLRTSSRIDDRGFLTELYAVEDACEMEPGGRRFRFRRGANRLAERMRARQVPGDGSCLFHSLTVALAYTQNGTHHDMQLKELKEHSSWLRQIAVDVLEDEPDRMLHLQGTEKMTADELLHAVAQQYDVKPADYCRNMRRPAEWGGGPEIVVLANLLHRPIHVYELSEVRVPNERLAKAAAAAAAAAVGGGGGEDGSDDVGGSGEDGSGGGDEGGGSGEGGGGGDGGALRDGEMPAGGGGGNRTRGLRWREDPYTVKWCFKRIACFGSPKFDRCKGGALHILSADSRFPDLRPGDQLPNGNHFLALFPCSADDDDERLAARQEVPSALRGKRVRTTDLAKSGGESTETGPAVATSLWSLAKTVVLRISGFFSDEETGQGSV